MQRYSIWKVAIAGFVVGGMLSAPTLGQTIVTAGDDAWRTGGPGTEFSFGDPNNLFPGDEPPTIPADFFGPGSDPFEGTIVLVGSPLCSEPVGVLEATDTIVRRLTDSGDLDDLAPHAVDVELIALSLASIEPITVTFNGGQNPELWDVQVYLSTTAAQPVGTMTITKTHDDGGTFDSTFGVIPRFIFVRQSPAATMVLDCGASPGVCEDLELGNPPGEPNSWVLIGGPGGIARTDFAITDFGAGIGIDEDCDGSNSGVTIGTSNFQGGLEASAGLLRTGDPVKCKPSVEAERRFAGQGGRGRHGNWISSPADDNGDGIPDVCQFPCCHTDGTCSLNSTEDACDLPDVPLKAGTDCEPTEACCMPDGSCVETNVECCALAGGAPLGPGSVCLGDTDADGINDACDPQKCGNDTREDPEQCDGTDDAKCPGSCLSDCTCAPDSKIPAVSDWGLGVLLLMVLTAGTVVLGRRRYTAA